MAAILGEVSSGAEEALATGLKTVSKTAPAKLKSRSPKKSGEYTIRELAEETLRQIPESESKLVTKPLPSDDPKRRKPDITLAKELLGWEPKVTLREGLAKTIAYFRSR